MITLQLNPQKVEGIQVSIQDAAKESATTSRLQVVKDVTLEEDIVVVEVAILNEINNPMFKVLNVVNDDNVKNIYIFRNIERLIANL